MSTKLFICGLRAAARPSSGEEGSGMAAEKKALAPCLYASPFSKAYWRDAVRELGKVRMLAVAAILIAVRVALKSVAIPIAPPTLMINLGFFVNALAR